MPDLDQLAGYYVGRCRVREGMEAALVPAEKKRFLKTQEEIALELHANGAFVHRRTTSGRFAIQAGRLDFTPVEFNGLTEKAMRQAAEEAGRAFGLAWLFKPFSLDVVGTTLRSTEDRSLIYVEYVRVGRV
jgi:hypothetical protein